jgi:CMP-N-acetylneuraminic acid synthetase
VIEQLQNLNHQRIQFLSQLCTEPAPVIAVTNSAAHDSSYEDSIIVSSDGDKDKAQEAAEVAEEEAEMARTEEAPTTEKGNFQREIREFERSDD